MTPYGIRGRLRRAARELLRDGSAEPAETEASRRIEDYPAPYPNGWYRVANSDELRPGNLRRVSCLGRELVAFRGETGQVSVVDAYCPHQGSHLAVGGTVKGNCIRCPFHHWEFGADGALEKIPNLDKLPRIRLGTWPVTERYGMIWIYHDAGAPHVEPPYPFEPHENIDDGSLVYRGEHWGGDVGMHLIEFTENSVDFQHFPALHGNMVVPWTQLSIPFTRITHHASWEIDEDREHIAYFHDHAWLNIFGKELPQTAGDATITLFGPGGAVWFRFSFPDVGDITVFQTHTPMAPLRQRVYFRWYASPSMPRPMVWYVVGSWISQWTADVAIWENKVYKKKPMLSRADGPVHKMRRWYRQFYPESLAGRLEQYAATAISAE